MTTTELVADGAVGLEDATKLSGLQRSKLYELMGEGKLVFVKVGARRLIPRRAITALLAANIVGGDVGRESPERAEEGRHPSGGAAVRQGRVRRPV